MESEEQVFIVLKRVEPEEQMDGSYVVLVQPTLFDPVAVICAWGNRQTAWQQMRILSALSSAEAQALANEIVEQKIRRGYEMVLAESRDNKSTPVERPKNVQLQQIGKL